MDRGEILKKKSDKKRKDIVFQAEKKMVNVINNLQGSMSSLTPDRVSEIENKRKEYLSKIYNDKENEIDRDEENEIAIRVMRQYASDV